MLDVSVCKLFQIKRKKELFYLLNFFGENQIKQVSQQYNPFIGCKSNGKKRLVEAPSKELKKVQKKIKTLLSNIPCPEWFISTNHKSYLDNYKLHINNDYVVTLDIQKFFPNCQREHIYCFFKEVLQTSPDIAKLLTDLSVIDLRKIKMPNTTHDEILSYIDYNNIKSMCHLPTGSPSSPILSFLAFHKMFLRLKEYADNNNILMSIYVDDLTFSGDKYISKRFIFGVNEILHEYGHSLNIKKVKLYSKQNFKQITGVVISPNRSIKVPNKLRFSIMNSFKKYKLSQQKSETLKKSIMGKVSSAKLIEKNIFRGIYKYVK